jgi:hypothetical protein
MAKGYRDVRPKHRVVYIRLSEQDADLLSEVSELIKPPVDGRKSTRVEVARNALRIGLAVMQQRVLTPSTS